LRYSCGHVSTKKNVRGIKDAAASTPPQLRSSRYIRYRDNIGYPRYGERYDIGDNQYSSNNLSYCPINRFLESVPTLRYNRGVETQCLSQPPPSALSQAIPAKVERHKHGGEAQCPCQRLPSTLSLIIPAKVEPRIRSAICLSRPPCVVVHAKVQ
jgi:hypothetical protein